MVKHTFSQLDVRHNNKVQERFSIKFNKIFDFHKIFFHWVHCYIHIRRLAQIGTIYAISKNLKNTQGRVLF